ncbi:MAG: preprotein translocase subunit SecY, partial [Flavobacteriaceae bacterium]|nr:preprotein translocase subunit SecY [Flavobacteriaceae bacterium]
MKKLISTVQDIWKIEELRSKILITLSLMVVYRLAAQVPLPGIDPSQLTGLANNTNDGLLGLLNAFTGGAFAKASIMALGIMPYISASIV